MENDRKNINMQIGKRLREARRNMNIDRLEFADALEVTEEHYRKLEAGIREETYHLYIFDIEMPQMNGLELAKENRKRDAKAALWTAVNGLGNPILNLVALIGIFTITTLFYESSAWSRIVNIVIFVSVGIIVEPIGLVLLRIMNYSSGTGEQHKYYFVVVLEAFIRGNILYLLSKVLSRKNVSFSKLPKGIMSVLIMIPVFTVFNCCFITMLYMMERVNYLEWQRHEDELYRKEMYYKEVYYLEAERRNEYVHNLRHDIKNKLISFHYLLEKGDIGCYMETYWIML